MKAGACPGHPAPCLQREPGLESCGGLGPAAAWPRAHTAGRAGCTAAFTRQDEGYYFTSRISEAPNHMAAVHAKCVC